MLIRTLLLSLSISIFAGCMKPSQRAKSTKSVDPLATNTTSQNQTDSSPSLSDQFTENQPDAAPQNPPNANEAADSGSSQSPPASGTDSSIVTAPPSGVTSPTPTPNNSDTSKSAPTPSPLKSVTSTSTPKPTPSAPASKKTSTPTTPPVGNPFLPNDQQPSKTIAQPSAPAVKTAAPVSTKDDTSRQFNCLNKYYPNQFKMSSDKKFIVFNDGTKLVWDDGRNKVPDELFAEADINDIFHDLYNPGIVTYPPVRDFDPGRYRPQAFYKKLFGATEAQVRKNLVSIPLWNGAGSHQFSNKYGAVNALKRVVPKINALMKSKPQVIPFLVDPKGIGGTFKFRPIKDTNLFSMHSFGIAVDIVRHRAQYWLDSKKGNSFDPYHNTVPYDIVRIFESEKFIWGGKWHHYDTMHFEYRPELFCMLENK